MLLGERLNASGGSKAAVTANNWSDQILRIRGIASLKMKGEIYRSCVWWTMLCDSMKWDLRENHKTILKTEKAITAMSRAILIEKRRGQAFMHLPDLEKTLDRIARAKRVRWYGPILRGSNNDMLRKALDFEVLGRWRRRLKMILRR